MYLYHLFARLHLLAAGRIADARFVFQGNVRLYHRFPLVRGAGCFACRDPSHGPACERWVLRCEAVEAPGAGGAGPVVYRAADFRTCGGDMCCPPCPPRCAICMCVDYWRHSQAHRSKAGCLINKFSIAVTFSIYVIGFVSLKTYADFVVRIHL